MKLARAALALTVASGIGCGSPSNPAAVDSNSPGPDSTSDDGWTTIAARSWSLGIGEHDKYKCTRIKVDQDMYISGFRSLSPIGTHHSVLTISTSSTTLGDYDCSAGSLDFQMLYAAGVNTDDLLFPDRVAMKITAGQYVNLNLNLHLFNASDSAESGMSGVKVKLVPAADAATYTLADMTFSGTQNINIPSDNTAHTATGGCAAPNDWHVFTLWPHMHQLANHQSLSVNGLKLLDTDYAFTEQRNYPMADTLIHKGDRIDTTCTYVNNTGHTVAFGDSSTDEMCFTGLYKYPAGGNLFQCALGN